MFMNTIAVGPLEEVGSCVTGGTTVAIALLEAMGELREAVRRHGVGEAVNRNIEAGEARLERRVAELRMVVLE